MNTFQNQNNFNKNYNYGIFEKNEFNEPNRQIKWKFSSQNTFHFKQDIERIWLIMRNFELLSTLCDLGNFPAIITKGKDTCKVGNEFKGIFFGKVPYFGKVQNVINLPEIKKIEWLLNLDNNQYFMLTIELFKVTENNSTVAIKKFQFESEELNFNAEKANYKIIDNKLFEKLDILLEKEPINLLKYESTIINGKMEDIWSIITNPDKLTPIAPNNNFLPNINLRNMNKEEKKQASIFYNGVIRNLDVVLKFKEENPGWNKWLIVAEISGETPVKTPKYNLAIQLTKISNKDCQLSLLTKYLERVDDEEFNEISNRKKYLLSSLKDYFENFYSPTN